MSNIAAAVSLNKANAMPAAPVGNMEKSLCIAPTLTISASPDKREKGAKATILLRGLRKITGEYSGPGRASDSPVRRHRDKITLPAAVVLRAGEMCWGTAMVKPLQKVADHG